MLDYLRLQRVRSRLLVFYLHPHWTELIHLTCLAKFLLLDWSLPILPLRCNCDPALRLRYNLHHFLWLAVRVLVNNVFVNGGIIFLVESCASSALLGSISLKHSIDVKRGIHMLFLNDVQTLIFQRCFDLINTFLRQILKITLGLAEVLVMRPALDNCVAIVN